MIEVQRSANKTSGKVSGFTLSCCLLVEKDGEGAGGESVCRPRVFRRKTAAAD